MTCFTLWTRHSLLWGQGILYTVDKTFFTLSRPVEQYVTIFQNHFVTCCGQDILYTVHKDYICVLLLLGLYTAFNDNIQFTELPWFQSSLSDISPLQSVTLFCHHHSSCMACLRAQYWGLFSSSYTLYLSPILLLTLFFFFLRTQNRSSSFFLFFPEAFHCFPPRLDYCQFSQYSFFWFCQELRFNLDSKLSMKYVMKICQTVYFELKCIGWVHRFPCSS